MAFINDVPYKIFVIFKNVYCLIYWIQILKYFVIEPLCNNLSLLYICNDMENTVIFNSGTSLAVILILLILGYKDIKIGISLIVLIAMFYITYLSHDWTGLNYNIKLKL